VVYLTGGHPRVLPEGLGEMLTPMKGNLPRSVWAADTGCFTQAAKYEDESYVRWLAGLSPSLHRCLFATAPDVVGDANATLVRALPMLDRIRDVGYRVALVGQDGMTPPMVPWNDINALFIGGTTAWKLGEGARELTRVAKQKDKWVHMGRVNSERRVMYAKSIGCDSVDGTYIAFGPDRNGPRAAKWAQRATMQGVLW
jgi:hypothetical protein